MQFVNTTYQKEFDKNGYILLNLLDSIDIQKLNELYNNFSIERVADFQVSNYEKNSVKNHSINEGIKKIISDKISIFFTDYRMLSAFFYIKYTGNESSFYLHKDWNVVDESKHNSIHIWIPLTDTNKKNGNLFICPFDYKLNLLSFRGSPGFQYPESNKIIKLLNKWYQVDLHTKKGQAICFKHSMTHGSRGNLSENVRVAAGISLIFNNAPMVHYHQNKEGEIFEYKVSDDFYLDFDLNSAPEKFTSVKKIR